MRRAPPKPLGRRCRWCGLLKCPHCPGCGANLVDTGHDRGCTRGPHCRACLDTFKDSRGNPCAPCAIKGLIPAGPAARGGGLFD